VTILELDGIAKRFGGVVALAEASLRVRRGTVHALLGENGAGKTTLMRIAGGLIRPDAGALRLRGAPFRPASPAQAMACGLGMVHQHFAIVPSLTVAEHIALVLRGKYDVRRAAAMVRETGERTGLALDPSRPAGDLGVSAQQRLEIVKALATNAEILILDEPTAVLTPAESGDLLTWIRTFRAGGGSVVLITHKLHEALGIADDLTVLRRGRVVLTGRRHELSREQVVSAMLGDSRLDLDTAVVQRRALAATVPVVGRVSTSRCGAWAEKRARPSGPNQPLMSTTTWVGAEVNTHTEPSVALTPTMAASAVSRPAT